MPSCRVPVLRDATVVVRGRGWAVLSVAAMASAGRLHVSKCAVSSTGVAGCGAVVRRWSRWRGSVCCSCERQRAAAGRHWCDARLRAGAVRHCQCDAILRVLVARRCCGVRRGVGMDCVVITGGNLQHIGIQVNVASPIRKALLSYQTRLATLIRMRTCRSTRKWKSLNAHRLRARPSRSRERTFF